MVGPFVEGDILQIIFLAVLFGVALNAVGHIGGPVLDLINRVTQIVFKILNYIMKLAPLGAFGAMAYAIGKYGVSTLTSLGSLIALFYVTSALFVFVVLGSVMAYLRLNIWHLLKYLREELLLILGTSTAEPALPGLMRKLEYAGVSKPTVGLVVPTGYSFNLDGAAIYLSLAALYIAQATNTHLTIGQQIGLLAVMLLTSKGAAGVAGGGFIALTATLSTLGHHPGGRHHADLRHRQVHVRMPCAGQLHRQRGGHPVRRQMEPRTRRRPRPRRVRRQGRGAAVRPQRGSGRQPVRPRRPRTRPSQSRPAGHGRCPAPTTPRRSGERGRHQRSTRLTARPAHPISPQEMENHESPHRTRQVQRQPDRCRGRRPLGRTASRGRCDSRTLPLADGGDGSVAAALAAGFRSLPVDVHGATGRNPPRRCRLQRRHRDRRSRQHLRTGHTARRGPAPR